MSSLAAGRRGLEELELFLAGLDLFTAAELAAADLLLQLSVAGAKGDGVKAASSTTPSSSPWSFCDRAEEVEQAVAVEVEGPAPSTEPLDRRARKRHRLLSDLYAATSPVPSAATKQSKRRRHGGYGGAVAAVVGGGEDEVRGGDH